MAVESRRPWKGKSKASDQDFEDLNPSITYRHLLAQQLGHKDPLRVIALCDSDAFYAGCEMVRLGIHKDIPLVVLQWDMVIAVNYAARKYGIARGKPDIKELKEKHPDLMVVHVATYKEGEKEPGYWDNVDTKTHKVSLDYYRRESAKIAAKFKDCLPDCEIEKASIDEAFFDLTKPVRETILQRYPLLAKVPHDALHGLDTPLPPPPPIDWSNLGYVIPVASGSGTGEQETETLHNASTKEMEEASTWHDVALSIGAELMAKARDTVSSQLGYWTSAGIARNKFLAKLTASCKKPNSQSILRNAAIPSYLRPLSFQKIRFLGGKLGTALAKEFEANTVGDLLSITLDDMQRKFGEESIWIYEVLRGIDRSEVKEKSVATRSMQASKNLPKPITNASEGFHWIRVLAAELALRLNEAREHSPHLWPKSLVLRARKGYEPGHSKQGPFPFTNDVSLEVIAAAGNKLWKELVGTDVVMNVTSVSLSLTGIEEPETGQQSIEGFLKRRREQDDDTMMKLAEPVDNDNGEDPIPSSLSFTCNRCHQRISISRCLTLDPSTEHEAKLAMLRLEHDDFHYAQDLVALADDKTTRAAPVSRTKKKKHENVKDRGIEQYFRRKVT